MFICVFEAIMVEKKVENPRRIQGENEGENKTVQH